MLSGLVSEGVTQTPAPASQLQPPSPEHHPSLDRCAQALIPIFQLSLNSTGEGVSGFSAASLSSHGPTRLLLKAFLELLRAVRRVRPESGGSNLPPNACGHLRGTTVPSPRGRLELRGLVLHSLTGLSSNSRLSDSQTLNHHAKRLSKEEDYGTWGMLTPKPCNCLPRDSLRSKWSPPMC